MPYHTEKLKIEICAELSNNEKFYIPDEELEYLKSALEEFFQYITIYGKYKKTQQQSVIQSILCRIIKEGIDVGQEKTWKRPFSSRRLRSSLRRSRRTLGRNKKKTKKTKRRKFKK